MRTIILSILLVSTLFSCSKLCASDSQIQSTLTELVSFPSNTLHFRNTLESLQTILRDYSPHKTTRSLGRYINDASQGYSPALMFFILGVHDNMKEKTKILIEFGLDPWSGIESYNHTRSLHDQSSPFGYLLNSDDLQKIDCLEVILAIDSGRTLTNQSSLASAAKAWITDIGYLRLLTHTASKGSFHCLKLILKFGNLYGLPLLSFEKQRSIEYGPFALRHISSKLIKASYERHISCFELLLTESKKELLKNLINHRSDTLKSVYSLSKVWAEAEGYPRERLRLDEFLFKLLSVDTMPEHAWTRRIKKWISKTGQDVMDMKVDEMTILHHMGFLTRAQQKISAPFI